MFVLHPQLQADTHLLGQLPLCQVLLSKDANYPWCILVPQRDDVREIHHLNDENRMQLGRESCRLAEVMVSIFEPDSMNVAAIGNIVKQLHLHHVVRFESDVAWPASVWGRHPTKEYEPEVLKDRISRLKSALSGEGFVESSDSSTLNPNNHKNYY